MPGPSQTTLANASALLGTAGRMARHEWRLAQVEIGENLRKAGVGIALIAAAALLGLVSAFALVGAGVAGLVAAGLPVWLAALLIGAAIALIAVAMALIGARRLKAKRLIPDRTLRNIQRDVEALKEALNA